MYIKFSIILFYAACPEGTYKPNADPGDIRSCLKCPHEHQTSPRGSGSLAMCTCKENYFWQNERYQQLGPLYLLEYSMLYSTFQITKTKLKLKFQVCRSRLPSTSSPFEWIFCPQCMSQCIQFSMWYKVDLFKNHTIQRQSFKKNAYYVRTQLIV